MGMRMFGSHMMPEMLQGTYSLSVGFGKSTEEVQRGKLETSAFALRKVLGDSDLFTLVHSGRSDVLPALWKADTPTLYSALLKDAGVRESVSISLRAGAMFAGVDGSVWSLPSLMPHELYITSLAISIVQRKRKDMQVPYIVLLPSSLRPDTRLDAARLCALAGGQLVIISQELEREAAKMINDLEMIPIIPDNMRWGKLPW
jgi:hypothetical protein